MSTDGGRHYHRLFAAMNTVLEVLTAGGDEEAALTRSFEQAAKGFAADRALLLMVEKRDPLVLRRICVRGLSEAEVQACERGESAPGVSASLLRSVCTTRVPVAVETPESADAMHTPAFGGIVGGGHSVLCAPIVDPIRDLTLAVMYFQRDVPEGGEAEVYGDADAVWLKGYAAAIGRAFAARFQERCREQELQDLLQRSPNPENAPEIVGESSHTMALLRELHEFYIPAADAPDPEPVLVLGERGTGKDLVARYIHAFSARRQQPFVALNCGELTDEMAAARFFGHRRGAFTGALSDEKGLFRAADRGVLFLDEIGELSPRAQTTLLRVLENRTLVPVGGTQEVRVDVQVILATNRDLATMVDAGTFRADLADRFTTHRVHLAALRERPWDVALLVRHFVHRHERRTRKRTLGPTPEAVRLMVSYAWPGNVREVDRVCSLLVTRARRRGHRPRAPGGLLPCALRGARGAHGVHGDVGRCPAARGDPALPARADPHPAGAPRAQGAAGAAQPGPAQDHVPPVRGSARHHPARRRGLTRTGVRARRPRLSLENARLDPPRPGRSTAAQLADPS